MGQSPTNSQSLAIDNQLLVSQTCPIAARSYIETVTVTGKSVSTIFENTPSQTSANNIDIFRLKPGENVYKVVDHARALGAGASVSPNHIMMPSPAGDNCPATGPSQLIGALPVGNPSGASGVAVTVIDAGYYWDDKWGTNPLAALCTLSPAPQQAEWLNAANVWVTEPAEPYQLANGDLVALAGHANAVAGVIAQNCVQPNIAIWSHNAAWDWSITDPPLESAVLRSIIMSQQQKQTPLINLGFAFYPYGGVVSDAWTNTLAELATINPDALIVCPAGNQGMPEPRCPAVLGGANPKVLGVGSISSVSPYPPSPWSNVGSAVTGAWVTCSADGETVDSTFIRVTMPPEEEPALPHDYAANSWVVWSGTSFAAPKITALIASNLTGPSPPQVWDAIIKPLGGGGPASNVASGYLFP